MIDAATSVAYFDALAAPSKTLVWFEESAHEPPVEESAKFNRAMVDLVWPVAAHGAPVAASARHYGMDGSMLGTLRGERR